MRLHRKLFPAALSSTNQSGNCSGFCDPLCPYNCYPYSQYIFVPPPPPQQPPPQLHHTPNYLIITVSLLAAFSILIGYYFFITKCCCRSRTDIHGPDDPGENPEDGFLDDNRMDHPIWFITRIGLNQSVINSISVCNYKKGEGLIEGTECSVCLSEFQENETLRLLPKCNHAFHISCIDTWLRSHTNCPLCRACIVTDSVSVSPNLGASDPISRAQSDNRDNIGDGSSNINESRETGTETEERGGAGQVIGATTTKDDANYEPSRKKNTLKRSFSLDSIKSATTMCLSIDDHDNNNENNGPDLNVIANRDPGVRFSGSFKRMGSSSVSQRLHKSPVSMKRSCSCGGRFFSSRQHRSLSSFLAL